MAPKRNSQQVYSLIAEPEQLQSIKTADGSLLNVFVASLMNPKINRSDENKDIMYS